MSDHRPPPYFSASSLELDFVNTLSTIKGIATEWLMDGDDLLAWLEAADLVSLDVLVQVRMRAARGELDAVAAEARDLREWLRALILNNHGAPLRLDDVSAFDPVNAVLARDDSFTQIVIRYHARGAIPGTASKVQQRWQRPGALLLPVAKAIANLICEDDFTHIKICDGHGCNQLFIDRTASHRRRWCDMAICGNRAKQSQKRARLADPIDRKPPRRHMKRAKTGAR